MGATTLPGAKLRQILQVSSVGTGIVAWGSDKDFTESIVLGWGGGLAVVEGGTFVVDLISLCNIDPRHFLRGKCLALILLSTFM